MSKITFSYIETHDFQEDLEISMEVPERTIDEMCEYFQRFLLAAGYIFEDGHTIRCVPPAEDNALEFPSAYYFGDTVINGSYGTDTISFHAAAPVTLYGGGGTDTITFEDHLWG
jgi:hypothetical protein